MTIYIDDFHTLPASIAPSPITGLRERCANMIADDRDELHNFARKIGLGTAYYKQGDYYRVPMAEAAKAVLLGAVLVGYRDLAAMWALRSMGFDMEPVATAYERRHALALADDA